VQNVFTIISLISHAAKQNPPQVNKAVTYRLVVILMRVFYILFFLIITALISNNTLAQQKPIPLKKIYTDSVSGKKKDTTDVIVNGKEQKDIYNLISDLLNKKEAPVKDSITSVPVVSIAPAVGYTLVSRLAIVLSGNIEFRTDPSARVSTIIASADYTQNKQFTLPVQTSIWTKNNKYNFVGDYRYFKYPQSTYGLGSNSDISHEDPMDYSYFRFYETALRRITGDFYAGAGYIIDRHWDIEYLGNEFTRPAFEIFGRPRSSTASGFTLNALFNSRDNDINASKGIYANVIFRTSIKDLGSTSEWQSLIVDVRKYFKFPAGSDNVIALWSYDWLILDGHPSYLDLPSTSWDANSATGRGYIQGRFRGAQMVYFEAEYRYKITANGLLGGAIFANAESFSAQQGTKLQSIQPAFGPGLRIKLNKLSKTNIAVDYGFGNQGSRGLFIDIGEAF